jgi:poly(beta-D-mannuronate) lyase
MKIRSILAAILLITGTFTATEYRVSTSSGFTSALSSIKAGDTITILNGTYTNWAIAFNATGTQAAPILLRAETVGGVILSGTSSMKIGGKYLIANGFKFTNGYITSGSVIEFRNSSGSYSSYCRLTNTSIVDYNNPDTTTDNVDSKWVSIYGKYNRVDHCYIKGKRNLGTTLVVWRPDTTANYAQIDSNYFGPRPLLPTWVGSNGAETIRMGTSDYSLSSSYSIVEHNYFEMCNGEIETISNKSCNNIYRYNTFVSCQGTLTLRHGNKCSVYGNYFFCNHKTNSGGIRIIGEDHKVYNNYISGGSGSSFKSALTIMNGYYNSALSGYYQVKRALVAFNTFVDNVNNFNIGAHSDTSGSQVPLDCVIANNIVYGTSSPLVAFNDTPINMTWIGNIFFGATTGFTTFPANNFNVDPKLQSADSYGIRHLSSSSPAINAALGTYDTLIVDMDGQTRDAKKDIGADEYSTATALIVPMNAASTGPRTTTTGISDGIKTGNVNFRLMQNYPNPFNPATTLRYSIPQRGNVSLKVFNSLGKEVKELVNQEQPQGTYQIRFDASALASGVYYSTLCFNGMTATQKIILMK